MTKAKTIATSTGVTNVNSPAEQYTEVSRLLEDQQELVLDQADAVGTQSLEELAGLVTVETSNSSQLIGKLKLNDSDKELVYAAIDVLAEVIERKITNQSTRTYLGLLLVFIKSALSI